MAKKKKSVVSEQATTITLEEQPAIDDVGFDLGADIQLGPSDIVNVAVAEFETRVNEEIEEGKTLCSALKKEVEAGEASLSTSMQKYADKHKTEVPKAAQAFYKAMGLNFQKEVEACNPTPDGNFTIAYKFFSEKTKATTSYSNKSGWSYKDVWDYTSVVEFKSAGLGEQLAGLESLREQLEAANKLQLRWREQLSKMGTVERHARAQLSAAVMAQSDKGQKLHRALMNQFDERMLGKIPAMSSLLLPAPKKKSSKK